MTKPLAPCRNCGGPCALHENDYCDPPMFSVYCTALCQKEYRTAAEAIAAHNRPPSILAALSPGLSTSAERATRCLDNLAIDTGAKLALIERIVAAMAEAKREAFETCRQIALTAPGQDWSDDTRPADMARFIAETIDEHLSRSLSPSQPAEETKSMAAVVTPDAIPEADIVERLRAKADDIAHQVRGQDLADWSEIVLMRQAAVEIERLRAVPEQTLVRWIRAIHQEISELSDRNNPAIQPHTMLVTGDELEMIIRQAIGGDDVPATPSSPTEAQFQRVEAVLVAHCREHGLSDDVARKLKGRVRTAFSGRV